jgi:hypothetical protein
VLALVRKRESTEAPDGSHTASVAGGDADEGPPPRPRQKFAGAIRMVVIAYLAWILLIVVLRGVDIVLHG